MCLSEKKEGKKKNVETEAGVVHSLGRTRAWIARGPGSHDGLGRIAAWVCAAWSCLCCISISSSSLSFFSFFPHFFLLFLHFGSLIIIIFGLEIESQKLDFHVDVTWKKCHIRREQLIKIESQKLDLQTLNRVSQTRNASKKYSLETRTTYYIVMILWSFGHFSRLHLCNSS